MVEPQLLELIQHRHRVDGLGVVEHGVDGLVDLPVLLKVKVLGSQKSHHVGDAPAVNEDRAQNRLLCFQRLGLLSGQKLLIHIHSLLSFGLKKAYASSIFTVRGAVIS